MRLSRRTLALALVATALSAACAGTRPVPQSSGAPVDARNFSGTWRLESAGAAVRGGGAGTGRGTGQGGGLGLGPPPADMTIQQDATRMEIRYTGGQTHIYRLDGTRTENPVSVGGGAASGIGTFESRWQDATLVTTFSVTVGSAAPRTYRETRSIAGNGTMIVEVAVVSAPGARGGGAVPGRRSVYRRTDAAR